MPTPTLCSYCQFLTWIIIAFNIQLLERANGKGINFLTNEVGK